MIFADASSLVSLMMGEADADALARSLEQDTDRICSALAAWETATALCRSYKYEPALASRDVHDYLHAEGFRFVNIGPAEFEAAADAYARYGKGRHRASLNMGDCFAYACARTNGAKLLYKGSDFAHTDLA